MLRGKRAPRVERLNNDDPTIPFSLLASPHYIQYTPPREKERILMIKVGVIGLGMMGQTHLDVYAKRPDVRVVAISDRDPDRLSGKTRATGNVEGQAQGAFDLSQANGYAEGMDLIKDKDLAVSQ